jgi:hypothetical protein
LSGPRQFSFVNATEPAPHAERAEFGVMEDEAEAPPPRPVPVRKAPAVPITPKDVVKLAKARLRDVKKELRRLQLLEKERAELERLIEAAEGRQVLNQAGKVIGTIKRSVG